MSVDDVFAILTIRGPEAGVDILVDNFTLEHGSNKVAKDKYVNKCASLVDNSDASLSEDSTFPFTSFHKSDPLVVKKDPTTGNSYFHLANRSFFYSSLTFKIDPLCTIPDSEYEFSMKIRVHSQNEIRPRVLLRIVEDGSVRFETISVCPPTSQANSDFVTCTGTTHFTPEHSDAEELQVLVVTNDDNNKDDVDYDDISFATPQGYKMPSDSVSGCWEEEAKAIFTTESVDYNDRQTVMVGLKKDGRVDFVPVDGNAQDDFKYPTSTKESDSFAQEIALLDRNIVFSGDGDIRLFYPVQK
jgi:hypothetical protein